MAHADLGHFGNKDDLFDAVFDAQEQRRRSIVEAVRLLTEGEKR